MSDLQDCRIPFLCHRVSYIVWMSFRMPLLFSMNIIGSSDVATFPTLTLMLATIVVIFSTICWVCMTSNESKSHPKGGLSRLYSSLLKVTLINPLVILNSFLNFLQVVWAIFSNCSRIAIYRIITISSHCQNWFWCFDPFKCLKRMSRLRMRMWAIEAHGLFYK